MRYYFVSCFLILFFLHKVPPSPFVAARPAPTSQLSFEMVEAQDCDPAPRTPEETSELFSRLEDALIKQIEVNSGALTVQLSLSAVQHNK